MTLVHLIWYFTVTKESGECAVDTICFLPHFILLSQLFFSGWKGEV